MLRTSHFLKTHKVEFYNRVDLKTLTTIKIWTRNQGASVFSFYPSASKSFSGRLQSFWGIQFEEDLMPETSLVSPSSYRKWSYELCHTPWWICQPKVRGFLLPCLTTGLVWLSQTLDIAISIFTFKQLYSCIHLGCWGPAAACYCCDWRWQKPLVSTMRT